MKMKSSTVLELALELINKQEQQFVCPAIKRAETILALGTKHLKVESDAFKLFSAYRPVLIGEPESTKTPWWEAGDPDRIDTINNVIMQAKLAGD